MKKYKLINKKGGLTIPADIRREHNAFLGGDPVDIEVYNGSLIITPHTPTCTFCRNVHELVNYSNRTVCKDCIKNLAELGG